MLAMFDTMFEMFKHTLGLAFIFFHYQRDTTRPGQTALKEPDALQWMP